MSIYGKESYSTSKVAFLAGPIEHWWDTPEEPNRWYSKKAIEYRLWRDKLNAHLNRAGYLTYRPHEAFKGPWNERLQGVNDHIIGLSDFLVNMTPADPSIVALGTQHEIAKAVDLGKPVFHAAFPFNHAGDEWNDWVEYADLSAKRFVEHVDRLLPGLLH